MGRGADSSYKARGGLMEVNESPDSISVSTSMLQRIQQVQRYSIVHLIDMDWRRGGNLLGGVGTLKELSDSHEYTMAT